MSSLSLSDEHTKSSKESDLCFRRYDGSFVLNNRKLGLKRKIFNFDWIPKEKIEIFCDKSIIQIDNFRKMKGFNWPGFKRLNLWRQDKGQENCVEAFLDSIEKGKPSPISKEEIFEVSKLSIEIANSIN